MSVGNNCLRIKYVEMMNQFVLQYAQQWYAVQESDTTMLP